MSVVEVATERLPYDYAVELKELCQEALERTRGGAIERAFVTPNALSLDCTSLQIIPLTLTLAALAGANSGVLGGGHNHRFGAVNQFGFTIVVARECIPATKTRFNPAAPDPAILEDWAWTTSEDVWVIWNDLMRRMGEGTLFGGRCRELFRDGANALAASGMIGGWQINIRATIPGLDSSGS